MTFSPDGNGLIVGGMGAMRDPMSGNGKQTWQWFSWKDQPARKVASIHDGEHGNGLMKPWPSIPPVVISSWPDLWSKVNGTPDSSTPKPALYCTRSIPSSVSRSAVQSRRQNPVSRGAIGQEPLKDGSRPQFGRISIYKCA